MAKKYREVRRALRRAGWKPVRTRGSHEIWVHADGRMISLPAGGKPNRDVSVGLLAKLRRQTGLEELR